METLFELGLSTTRWMQENWAGTADFMQLVSTLGEFEIYLMLILLLYWTLDKRLGTHLAYALSVSTVCVEMGKHFFRGPRPFWLDGELMLDETAGYGVPSGHVNAATTAYTFLALWYRQIWLGVVAGLWIFLMILSRIYLAQHFLHDVAAGLLLGALVVGGYWVWRLFGHAWFAELILGQRFLAAVSIPLLLAAVYIGVRLIQGQPDMQVAWRVNIPTAELDSYEAVVANVAILLGMGTGFVLEGARVRFVVAGEWWKRLLRFVLGAIVAFAILLGGGILFDLVAAPEALLVSLPLRFIRYLILTLWGVYYAPWLFVRLGLAEAEPPPQISGSLNRLKPGDS